MTNRPFRSLRAWGLWMAGTLAAASAVAAGPDHPVITEVFQDPPATGGPVGRDPADPHQEFIEIYLPPLADLDPALNKDSLKLALYEVEGDSSSPGLSLVNYRIDLPAFDLDPSNSPPMGIPRPASGIVVLGWVDYVGDPAVDLAGTPSTRVALIDGGITSASDFTFIAINGNQFGGTLNFPTPVAVSHIDTLTDPVFGKIEEGSSAYLLVNRDDPGYAEVCGQTDPAACNDFPNLPGGTILGVSSLLDGFAGNDDPDFKVQDHPYTAPTGDSIDHEFVLPDGGAFSLLVPQVAEAGNGYRRVFVDLVKTSEDGILGNEDPVADSEGVYGIVANPGIFEPSPGRAAWTDSAAFLEVADASLQHFEVLTNTNARAGLVAANSGGDFGMNTTSTPSSSGTAGVMTIASATSSFPPIGQTAIAPAVEIQTFATTPVGHVESATVQIDATEASIGDPLLGNASDSAVATFTAIDPTTGLNALSQPFQATAFLAVHALPDQPGVLNEFASTSLASFMAPRLGVSVFDSRGHAVALLNPSTDLSNPTIVDPMIATMPTDPLTFINRAGALDDLVTTVLNSAEFVAGTGTYDDSFDPAQTLLQAREFLIQETATRGGGFVPTERIHYADATGVPSNPSSGLSHVRTGRDFEIALIETNLGPTGVIETGATDDFGIIVEVGQTRPGASVVPGEFVFLSFTGGLEGADIDSLDVPPHGGMTLLLYLDLDPLDSVLGAETITRLFVIDGSGSGEVDVLDVISLPEPGAAVSLPAGLLLLSLLSRRRRNG